MINKINPKNEWVYEYGIPTRKFDGTATAIINGEFYKRYDAKLKNGKYKKPIPKNAIPCQDADLITGHHPHWIRCDRNNPADKWHWKAFDLLEKKEDGTYELCGTKVQSNPENITGHILIKHGIEVLEITNFTYENIKKYLSDERNDIEGIVFHCSIDDRMCKIRKSDFGIRR